MKTKKRKYEVIDYVFWFLLLLMTNPGGIFRVFGDDTGRTGSIDMRDYVFALLFGCFLLIFYKTKINNATYKKVIKYLILFGLYYFIVFGYFVPILNEIPDYSTFAFLKKAVNHYIAYYYL